MTPTAREMKTKEIPMTPLRYIKLELDIGGDFVTEWKRLSDKDKEDLRAWAQEELAAAK